LLQFHVPHIHQGRKGSYKNKSVYGTVAVQYSDKVLLEVFNEWISDVAGIYIPCGNMDLKPE
jgi:hypothetical protein